MRTKTGTSARPLRWSQKAFILQEVGKDDGAQRGTPQTGAQHTPEPFKTNAAAADVQQDDFAVIDDSEDLPF